ncbi:DUF3037 domain-containing protein [Streptosporangium sp. NPDC051023]|uniref:DUF3037 domain-containing protein n=1 Tax=Streptosporangium sp. NPDC051023 TaxID=3155410 RepID=UPI00344C2424
MSRYLYSVVRCLPHPWTGEFVNVGVIAGSDDGDWTVKPIDLSPRARDFVGAAALGVAAEFLQRLQVECETSRPGEAWLVRLYEEHRNTIQLSPPMPVLADGPEAAAGVILDDLAVPADR